MQRDDRRRFAALMTKACEYWRRDMSEMLLEMYWAGLEPYDFDAISAAMLRHQRDPDPKVGSFMPMVNDIVRLIEGTSGDRAQVAWSKVHRAIRMVGPYQSLVFDDPIIHLVISDMGGFGSLCDVKTDEMQFRAREFEQRYRGYAARAELPQHPAKLVGDAEADCVARGQLQFVPSPVFIGDAQAAQRVLEGGRARVSMITACSAVLAALPGREKAA